MSKHTVMAWNRDHILVERVNVDRSTDECDPVMSSVHRLQRALGAKGDDPRWQTWQGDAQVQVLSAQTTEKNIDDLLDRLNAIPKAHAQRGAAVAALRELIESIEALAAIYPDTEGLPEAEDGEPEKLWSAVANAIQKAKAAGGAS